MLHVREHRVQLLPSCLHLGPAERAGPIGIVVREVNAHPSVRIGGIAPKAAKLLPAGREAFGG